MHARSELAELITVVVGRPVPIPAPRVIDDEYLIPIDDIE